MTNKEQIFWDKIYKANSSRMLGICRRYVKNIKIAEDLMHEAFLTAITKYKQYSGLGSFNGWLRKIVINTALMYLRNEKLRTSKELLIEEDIFEEELPNDIKREIDEANFSKDDLLTVIDNLPEHHKLVFNLYVIDDYSHKQISKELNISIGTSKSHLSRARRKIQQELIKKTTDLNKEQNKRKQAIFLFIPFKDNVLDKLYKRNFKSFEISPSKFSGEIFNSFELISKAKFYIKILRFVSNKIVIYSSSIILISVSILIIFKQEERHLSPIELDSIIQPPESNGKSIIIEKHIQDSTKTNLSEYIDEPVIERKTIIVRDTVKINDTADVE